MYLYIAILLAFIIRNSDAQYDYKMCWHEGRWVPEGTNYDRGRYYFECRGGKEHPKGCIAKSGQRLALYETFTYDNYEYTCKMDNRNMISIQVTGCIDRNSRFAPDQIWATSTNKCWKQCTKQMYDSLRADLMGCITPEGRKIKIGDIYNDGDHALQCRQSPANSGDECAVECHSCVHKGRRYEIGQSWPDDEYLYYCSYGRNKCEKVCVGCMFEGEELESGDRYITDQSVYQCDISDNKNAHRLVGCTYNDKFGSTIQRIVGCRWVLDGGYGKYEVECVDDGKKGQKEYRGCVYERNGVNYLSVEPGTYTIWWDGDEKMAVGCEDRGTNQAPNMINWNPSQQSDNRGLRYTLPRGAYSKRKR